MLRTHRTGRTNRRAATDAAHTSTGRTTHRRRGGAALLRIALVSLVALSLHALHALHATNARAHGGDPITQEVLAIEDGWVARANFGVLTDDQPDRFVCEEAFFGVDGFLLAALGRTRWIVWTTDRVWSTTDGCDFEVIATHDRPVRAAAGHPASKRAAWLREAAADADDAALLWTGDDGATIQTVPLSAPGALFTGARFADSATVIASGYFVDPVDPERGNALVGRVSLDEGTFTRLTALDTLTRPYVLAAQDQQLAGIATVADQLALFWWDGATLHTETLMGWPSAMRFTPDGAELRVAGASASGQVWRGTIQGDAPVWTIWLAEHSGACLERDGEDWLVCGRRKAEGHELTRVRPDGDISAALDFKQLRGVRACPADSTVAKLCPVAWAEVARTLQIDMGDPQNLSDMGVTPDHGTDGDMGSNAPAPGPTSDERCAIAPTERPAPTRALPGLLACLLLATRVRRRRIG